VWWAAPLTQRTVSVLLTAILLALAYPAYQRRMDLTDYRDQAKHMFQGPDHNDMFGWLRRELRPTDVVAAPESLSLGLVGPAGRKVLAVERFFSNPYVFWEPRHDALQALYAGLDRGICDGFGDRADRYHVTHVITRVNEVRTAVVEACGLSPEFTGREWVIYRRRDARAPAPLP
jgi:hypothetical protein